ncbi:MAG: SDR family oxidoreductase [Hyphomonadaceae bacterium]|nr:MAG: 3-oxoacyl-acyl-carrier protein reductase [Caulobacteraceae bacterium]MBT9447178.1 SDR family oxidoreductase [Hyphomonadaceae bacterium]TPW08200.1 MAG: 3-oxoacyl-acyl-carrier protein reductase [Alphaproteobacteria bacterium]
MRFQGKTVLILGGNSGIGLAAAKGFAGEGADVVITGRDQRTIDEAVMLIPRARGKRVDIADLASMDGLVDGLRSWGVGVDTLFVNAGIGGFAPLRDVTAELWDRIHSINLRGCFFAIQKALPLMRKGGSIVITGSIGADIALHGNVVYAAAKAGLKAVARTLARELVGEGIRVNMVTPGPIETPLIHRNAGMSEAEVAGLRAAMIAAVPMGRMGAVEEVGAAVLFLASQEASFITGAELLVDGGALELR